MPSSSIPCPRAWPWSLSTRLTADSGLSTNLPGGFPAALAGATINGGGIGYSLNLGTITNSTLPGGPAAVPDAPVPVPWS